MIIEKSQNTLNASKKAIDYIFESLKNFTRSGKTLWLLSGGSAIEIEANVSKLLTPRQKQNITLAQVDERVVKIGSKEHNWAQLERAGLQAHEFDAALTILQADIEPEIAASIYEVKLRTAIRECQNKVGVYGIGQDGHTAGIKPVRSVSSFKQFCSGALVSCYQASDYKRITTTAAVIKTLDCVCVYARGEGKTSVVESLDREIPAHKMPAQLLKLAKSVVIFT